MWLELCVSHSYAPVMCALYLPEHKSQRRDLALSLPVGLCRACYGRRAENEALEKGPQNKRRTPVHLPSPPRP